ncbi:MAG: type II toxin-antitoxin system HicA family toxin [Prevotellaceae bacterium]|jgi:predicted RNA binding protein YcfA (HicA-like mRNA interferase family)|nr:type II toxin-antitoxin system HicA family toxin [Prevotellaceae bacterium]
MKSTELHRKAIKSGWKFIGQDATSHRDYEKNGAIIRIPYHGAKEVPTGTCKKILKEIASV